MTDTIERAKVDDALKRAYREYKTATTHDRSTEKKGAVKALIPLSSHAGWGDVEETLEGNPI